MVSALSLLAYRTEQEADKHAICCHIGNRAALLNVRLADGTGAESDAVLVQ